MKTVEMQKHWYLGLLGLVGVWKFPEVLAGFTPEGNIFWGLSNLLWFLWFLYLVPEATCQSKE